jgi:hypothetical protein
MPKGGLKPAPFVLASIGPSSLNNIEGSLFTNTNTFLHSDVDDGVIEGSLLQDIDVFNDGVITLGNNIDASLFVDTDTLFHGFTDPTNLLGSLLSDADTLYHGLVSPINLFGSLLENTNQLYHGEILGLNKNISGSKLGQNITVLDSVTSDNMTSQESHTVNLPDGSNIVGRFLLVCVSADGTPTFTWPTGWTELLDSSSSNVSLGVAYREIDGTEGFDGSNDTILVTTSDPEVTTHISYLIENASTSSVEISAISSTNTNPNPPVRAPTSGYDSYCFVAINAHDHGSTQTTGYPSGYVNNQQINTGSTSGCGIGGAHLIKTTDSEDAGQFTISATRNWIAATISIINSENAYENLFNDGAMGFGSINMSGGLFQNSSTFNNGTVYFGVRLSTAQANKSGPTITADPFTIETARPWQLRFVALKL